MDKMEYHGIQHHIANSSWVGWLFQPSWKESVVAHHHRPKDWSKSNMFKATSQLSLNMANLGITDHFKHSMTISEQSLLLFIIFCLGIGEDLAIKCCQHQLHLWLCHSLTRTTHIIYLYIFNIVIYTYSIYNMYIIYMVSFILSKLYQSFKRKKHLPGPPLCWLHLRAPPRQRDVGPDPPGRGRRGRRPRRGRAKALRQPRSSHGTSKMALGFFVHKNLPIRGIGLPFWVGI